MARNLEMPPQKKSSHLLKMRIHVCPIADFVFGVIHVAVLEVQSARNKENYSSYSCLMARM
eukprot:767799-Hanusia_phi.AAC.4